MSFSEKIFKEHDLELYGIPGDPDSPGLVGRIRRLEYRAKLRGIALLAAVSLLSAVLSGIAVSYFKEELF